MVPTFLLVAWKDKRPPLAYVAGFATAIGVFSFSLYCAIRFGDALAFVHVQKGWEQPGLFEILSQALKGDRYNISRIVTIFGSGYLL